MFKVLFLALYVAWLEDPELCLGFARGENFYKVGSRYNKLSISKEIIKVADALLEQGSSGSALLYREERVMGVLFRGTASCSEPEGLDEYGRFDRAFERNSWHPAIRISRQEPKAPIRVKSVLLV